VRLALVLLASLALVGCAAARRSLGRGSDRRSSAPSTSTATCPSGSLPSDRRAATVIGHTRADGCAEAARRTFLTEEEIR
jgi:hypothetical protein